VETEFAAPAVPPPAGSPAGTASTAATVTSITVGPDGALWLTGVPGEVGRITTAGVVTEFAVPAIQPPGGWPPGMTLGMPTPVAMTAGPAGALWFTTQETDAAGVSTWSIDRITTNGSITVYSVPATSAPAITLGPDGNLWFTGVPGELGRITTAGVVSEFAVPGNFNTIAGLTSGPGGNLWFTEQEDGKTRGEQAAVGEINPAGVTTLYTLPHGTTLDPSLGVPTDPTVITTGPDGALWFGENGAIGRINAAGTIQQFPLPTPTATIDDITPGPDGAVWFVQQVPQVIDPNNDIAYSIGRITTAGTITMYPLSPDSTSAYITAGPDSDVWFTENLTDPNTLAWTAAIGRITPQGQTKMFALPKKVENLASVGNITVGPDGNLWFPFSYNSARAIAQAIGRITAKGNVKVYNVASIKNYGSYSPRAPSDIISGPEGKLWFEGTVHGKTGIGRISTSGRLGPVIPVANISSDIVRLPNGQVWFTSENNSFTASDLGIATRSGVLITQDLPGSSTYFSGVTVGPDGNLWVTSGPSSILRISGLDTVAGGLDYRHRPKRGPDYTASDGWTNVSGTAKPTFAGVARPGAEVTLSVQKQGDNQPVSIGQVRASKSDGSWTLTSHVTLSDGDYAVTAKQTGQTGPPSVLYSLEPDSSGNLSNALVIQAPHGG